MDNAHHKGHGKRRGTANGALQLSFYIDQEIADEADGPEGSMRAVVSDEYIGRIAEVHDGAGFCGIALYFSDFCSAASRATSPSNIACADWLWAASL